VRAESRRPPEILVATTNPGKLREIRQLLDGAPVRLRTLDEFSDLSEPEETGRTFADNALLKARAYASMTGLATVAEDSGLEIDALGLDAMDRRYLTMIADIYRGGPVGIETLAAGLSEPRDTIEDVIEPFLIQLGLIARTARGRCLNERGWKHLGLAPPKGSQTGLFDVESDSK